MKAPVRVSRGPAFPAPRRGWPPAFLILGLCLPAVAPALHPGPSHGAPAQQAPDQRQVHTGEPSTEVQPPPPATPNPQLVPAGLPEGWAYVPVQWMAGSPPPPPPATPVEPPAAATGPATAVASPVPSHAQPQPGTAWPVPGTVPQMPASGGSTVPTQLQPPATHPALPPTGAQAQPGVPMPLPGVTVPHQGQPHAGTPYPVVIVPIYIWPSHAVVEGQPQAQAPSQGTGWPQAMVLPPTSQMPGTATAPAPTPVPLPTPSQPVPTVPQPEAQAQPPASSPLLPPRYSDRIHPGSADSLPLPQWGPEPGQPAVDPAPPSPGAEGDQVATYQPPTLPADLDAIYQMPANATQQPAPPVRFEVQLPAPDPEARPIETQALYPDVQIEADAPAPAPAPQAPAAGADGDDYPRVIIEPDPDPAAPAADPGTAPAIEPEPGPDLPALFREGRYQDIARIAMDNQDAGIAVGLGWAYFRHNRHQEAASWFEQALAWDPSQGDAEYGWALTQFQLGDLDRAEAMARARPGAHPDMQKLLGDVTTARAYRLFQSAQYPAAIGALEEVDRVRGLNLDERLMLGWALQQGGHHDRAAAMFEEVYRSRRDESSADGLYAAYAMRQDWAMLQRLSDLYGGPLRQKYRQYQADILYSRGSYRAAAELWPEKYAELANINAPQARIGIGGGSRSGETEESEMNFLQAPLVQARFPVGQRGSLLFDFQGMNISGPGFVPERPLAMSALDNGDEGRIEQDFTGVSASIGYSLDDDWSPRVQLGVQQTLDGIGDNLTGRAGLTRVFDDGSFAVELFRRPINESVLSTVGLHDPLRRRSWGAVTATGLRGEVFRSVGNDLFFYGNLEAATYGGHNVATNEGITGSLAVRRNIDLDWTEYFHLGPMLTYSAFSRNLSQFSFGHGGYFSPQQHLQLMLTMDFLSRPGRDFVVQGSTGVGYQYNRQDDAPFFPLDPDERFYRSTSEGSLVAFANLRGSYLLSPNWIAWGGLFAGATPSYDEIGVQLGVTYSFGERSALYRDDLWTLWR